MVFIGDLLMLISKTRHPSSQEKNHNHSQLKCPIYHYPMDLQIINKYIYIVGIFIAEYLY